MNLWPSASRLRRPCACHSTDAKSQAEKKRARKCWNTGAAKQEHGAREACLKTDDEKASNTTPPQGYNYLSLLYCGRKSSMSGREGVRGDRGCRSLQLQALSDAQPQQRKADRRRRRKEAGRQKKNKTKTSCPAQLQVKSHTGRALDPALFFCPVFVPCLSCNFSLFLSACLCFFVALCLAARSLCFLSCTLSFFSAV